MARKIGIAVIGVPFGYYRASYVHAKRLRVVTDTKQTTLRAHVEQFTGPGTHVYTDEYERYTTIERAHTDRLPRGPRMGARCGWGWHA